MFKAITIVITLLSVSSCFASEAAMGNVYDVISHRLGVFLFKTDGARTGTIPSCATTQPKTWAIDTKTPEGRAMVSVILSAIANGKKIEVHGSVDCPWWSDTEGVDFIKVEN